MNLKCKITMPLKRSGQLTKIDELETLRTKVLEKIFKTIINFLFSQVPRRFFQMVLSFLIRKLRLLMMYSVMFSSPERCSYFIMSYPLSYLTSIKNFVFVTECKTESFITLTSAVTGLKIFCKVWTSLIIFLSTTKFKDTGLLNSSSLFSKLIILNMCAGNNILTSSNFP